LPQNSSMLRAEVERILDDSGIADEALKTVSIHGAIAINHLGKPGQLLVTLSEERPLRARKVNGSKFIDLLITIGIKEFEKDCLREELGGAAASQLLLPYKPLTGGELLKDLEISYKRHVISESLQNLILEHRLASSRLLIKPEYFLYDKLRKLSAVYLPIRPQLKACFEEHPKESLEATLPGFEAALKEYVSKGYLRKIDGRYSPSEDYIHRILSSSPAFMKFSRELEHVFKLYLSSALSSPLESLKEFGFNLSILKPPRLPDPLEFIDVETSLGTQSLRVDLGIREFVERFYGVRNGGLRIEKIAGVLNATYLAEFRIDGSVKKIFVKKYLNWTDFKWFVAWLWSIGVKNFSVLASIRMSNEIYFVNKLMELGFNTAEILHVSWPRRLLFQKYIEGADLLDILARSKDEEEFRRRAFTVGRLLAEIHEKGICLGDCNPFSFLFTPDDRIFLVDLEQCSYDDSFSWDLAELLYYTSHYLKPEEIDMFASSLAEGYLTVGNVDNLIQALDIRYARVLAPLALPWAPVRIRGSVMRVVRR